MGMPSPAATSRSGWSWTSASKKFDARLWVKNLNNATYYIARLGVTGLGDVQEQAPPRTFGITVGVHL